jgi:hypothetical protein
MCECVLECERKKKENKNKSMNGKKKLWLPKTVLVPKKLKKNKIYARLKLRSPAL